jgi:hypothetical protein
MTYTTVKANKELAEVYALQDKINKLRSRIRESFSEIGLQLIKSKIPDFNLDVKLADIGLSKTLPLPMILQTYEETHQQFMKWETEIKNMMKQVGAEQVGLSQEQVTAIQVPEQISPVKEPVQELKPIVVPDSLVDCTSPAEFIEKVYKLRAERHEKFKTELKACTGGDILLQKYTEYNNMYMILNKKLFSTPNSIKLRDKLLEKNQTAKVWNEMNLYSYILDDDYVSVLQLFAKDLARKYLTATILSNALLLATFYARENILAVLLVVRNMCPELDVKLDRLVLTLGFNYFISKKFVKIPHDLCWLPPGFDVDIKVKDELQTKNIKQLPSGSLSYFVDSMIWCLNMLVFSGADINETNRNGEGIREVLFKTKFMMWFNHKLFTETTVLGCTNIKPFDLDLTDDSYDIFTNFFIQTPEVKSLEFFKRLSDLPNKITDKETEHPCETHREVKCRCVTKQMLEKMQMYFPNQAITTESTVRQSPEENTLVKSEKFVCGCTSEPVQKTMFHPKPESGSILLNYDGIPINMGGITFPVPNNKIKTEDFTFTHDGKEPSLEARKEMRQTQKAEEEERKIFDDRESLILHVINYLDTNIFKEIKQFKPKENVQPIFELVLDLHESLKNKVETMAKTIVLDPKYAKAEYLEADKMYYKLVRSAGVCTHLIVNELSELHGLANPQADNSDFWQFKIPLFKKYTQLFPHVHNFILCDINSKEYKRRTFPGAIVFTSGIVVKLSDGNLSDTVEIITAMIKNDKQEIDVSREDVKDTFRNSIMEGDGLYSITEIFTKYSNIDPNCKCPMGYTALHLLALRAEEFPELNPLYAMVFNLLVEKGADVTIKNNDGKTVLDCLETNKFMRDIMSKKK